MSFKKNNIFKKVMAFTLAGMMTFSLVPMTSLKTQSVKAAESEDFYVGNAPCSSIDSLPNGTYENVTANVYVPGPLNKVLGVNAFLTNPNDPFGAGGGEETAPTDPVYNNAKLTVSGEGKDKKYILDVDIKNVVFTLLDAKSGDNIAIRDYTIADGDYLGYTGRISHFTFELKDLSGKYTLKDCVECPTILGAFWYVPLNVAVDFQSVNTKTNDYTFTDESGRFELSVKGTKENLDGATLVVENVTQGAEYEAAKYEVESKQLNTDRTKEAEIRMFSAKLVKDGKVITDIEDSKFVLLEKIPLKEDTPVGTYVWYMDNGTSSEVDSTSVVINDTRDAINNKITNSKLGYFYYVLNSNAYVMTTEDISDIASGVNAKVYGTLSSNAISIHDTASIYVADRTDSDSEIKSAIGNDNLSVVKAYDLCLYAERYDSTTYEAFSTAPFTLFSNESKVLLELPVDCKDKDIADIYDVYMITKNMSTGELSAEKLPSYKKDDNTIVADWMDISKSTANNDDLDRFVVNCSDKLDKAVDFADRFNVDNCGSYIAIVKNNLPETYDIRYNGTEQTGVAEGDAYTLSGTIKATTAGTYTAYATLKDGYSWSDGDTNKTKTVEWTLKPALVDAMYHSTNLLIFDDVEAAKEFYKTYTISYSGFIGDDSPENLEGFEAPTISLPELENGNIYNIAASGGNPTSNYEFNYIAPEVRIACTEINSPSNVKLQYTGSPQTKYVTNEQYTVKFEECDEAEVINTGFYHAIITANKGYVFSGGKKAVAVKMKIVGKPIKVKPAGVSTSGIYAEDVEDADMEVVSGLEDGVTLDSLEWKNGVVPKIKGTTVEMYDYYYNMYSQWGLDKETLEMMLAQYKGQYMVIYSVDDSEAAKNYEIKIVSAYENGIPVIASTETDKTGETVLKAERTTELVEKYKAATDNPLNVNLGTATVIPTEIMEVLKDKENTTVNLKMNNVVSTFNTDDIKDTKASKQTVTYDSTNIPEDVIEQYRNSKVNTVRQISRVSDGELGNATASLSLGGPAANEFANVYKYDADKKELELVSVSKADEKGNVSVTLPTSGDFVVMMSTKDMSDLSLDPGTYKITANLYVAGSDNTVLGVNAYLTNPNNPIGIVPDGFESVEPIAPITPVADNATIVVGEDGSQTLVLDVVNPVFTLQQIKTSDNADVLATVKDTKRYEGNNKVGRDGRITKVYIKLNDNSGVYKFKDCLEFPTLLEEEWNVPLTLDVDFINAVRLSDETKVELPDDNKGNDNTGDNTGDNDNKGDNTGDNDNKGNNDNKSDDNKGNNSNVNNNTNTKSDDNNNITDVNKDTKSDTSKSDNKTSSSKENVKTGDTNKAFVYAGIMLVAVMAASVTVVVSKKRRKYDRYEQEK